MHMLQKDYELKHGAEAWNSNLENSGDREVNRARRSTGDLAEIGQAVDQADQDHSAGADLAGPWRPE